MVVLHLSHKDKGTNHIKQMSKYSNQIETIFIFKTSTVKWALLCTSKNAIVSAKNIIGTLVWKKERNEYDETVSLCTHQYPLCSFMYTSVQMAFFCSHGLIFMYTRVQNYAVYRRVQGKFYYGDCGSFFYMFSLFLITL